MEGRVKPVKKKLDIVKSTNVSKIHSDLSPMMRDIAAPNANVSEDRDQNPWKPKEVAVPKMKKEIKIQAPIDMKKQEDVYQEKPRGN